MGDAPGRVPGLDDLQARWKPGAPVVMLVFYRSHLLAAVAIAAAVARAR